ncbi:E3 ubiquitin-protein ligase RNF31 isoform X4 [Gadus morhua]|uniref:E3 ubiquitin-protein ligase RNF31 isoform X4 n=1 Tax=Gadus morhua TaxID=8049 RepID=UPI0011B3EDF4|nr:E3 ubiquitin-protein ligase RNF31-like isoform X4 [Gadus morhua]
MPLPRPPHLRPRPLPGPKPPAAMPPSPPPSDEGCHLCGSVPTVTCATCSPMLFCDACDGIFHRHPARADHKREPIPPAEKECCSICGVLPGDMDCPVCVMKFCLECDGVYHQHPKRAGHPRTALTPPRASSSVPSPRTYGHCSVENPMQTVLCDGFERARPRLASPSPRPQEDAPKSPLSPTTDFQRPRQSPIVIPAAQFSMKVQLEPPPPEHRQPFPRLPITAPRHLLTRRAFSSQWTCEACLYRNPRSSKACEKCASPSGGGGGGVIPGPTPARVPDQIPGRAPPQDLSSSSWTSTSRNFRRGASLWRKCAPALLPAGAETSTPVIGWTCGVPVGGGRGGGDAAVPGGGQDGVASRTGRRKEGCLLNIWQETTDEN